MNKKLFHQKIAAAANSNVQDKIIKFKKRCHEAACELRGIHYSPDGALVSSFHDDEERKLFAILASNDIRKGWPKSLWEKEEEVLTRKIFKELSLIEQLILEDYPKGENTPEKP